MLTVQEFKNAIADEIRIARHVATKLDPARIDWRPSENQRSVRELLQYVALCGIGPARSLLDGSWDVVAEYRARHADLNLDGFDRAMQDQERELFELLDGLSEADLADREGALPWGTTTSLGQALYLASILASPQTQYFGSGGAVTPNRMKYLHTLMKIVHKIGRISDDFQREIFEGWFSARFYLYL